MITWNNYLADVTIEMTAFASSFMLTTYLFACSFTYLFTFVFACQLNRLGIIGFFMVFFFPLFTRLVDWLTELNALPIADFFDFLFAVGSVA